MFFGVLLIIFALLFFDFFVCIHRISVHWSWNFSLGVLPIFLWGVSKPDIWICFPRRFVEGHGEGYGWVFRLVHFNLLLCFIKNLLQVLWISLFFGFWLVRIMFIVLNTVVSTTGLLGQRTHTRTPMAQFRVRRQTDVRMSNYRKNEKILR